MASWTTPVTHATGDALSVTDWNGVANNETFLYQRPYGMYYGSVAQSCPNNVNTQVQLGLTAQGYGFSYGSAGSVTVPLTGLYQLSWGIGTANNPGSGPIWSVVFHNGVSVLTGSKGTTSTASYGETVGTGLVLANANDTVSMSFANTAGGAVTLATGAVQTWFHVIWLGSQ